jgi:hypothetical protein
MSASAVECCIEIAASLTIPSQIPAGVSAVQGLGSGKRKTLTSLSLRYLERPVFVRSSPQLESALPWSSLPSCQRWLRSTVCLKMVGRNFLLGSACSGQAAMTWCAQAVGRGSPHWQWCGPCGSNNRRRKRAVYSPLKAWLVRSLIPVLTIGRGYSETPFMNEGRLPSGEFVRGEVCWLALRFRCEGYSGGRVGVWRAAFVAMALKRRRGVDALPVGSQPTPGMYLRVNIM